LVEGDEIRTMICAGSASNTAWATVPLPDGDIAAIDAGGPAVLLRDGTLHTWNAGKHRWDVGPNLFEPTVKAKRAADAARERILAAQAPKAKRGPRAA
jgi:hypothetical protein